MSLAERAVSLLEDRLGVAVLPTGEATNLREAFSQFQQFREEASDLAWHSLDYFSGRPQEWQPERRKRLAQRARIALQGDPLAGAEAEHYANFGLARGISLPTAKEPRVQAAIDRAWTDHNNVEQLTGYDAQRAISHELKAGSNLFCLAFIRGSRLRVAWLDADSVENVVTDPEHRNRVLWYKARRLPKQIWNWETGTYEIDQRLEDGVPKPVWYAHWRNLEDARRERLADNVPEEQWPEELKDPPPEQRGKGLVYHVRTNRLVEQVFGVPAWARTLRFYTAMNRFTEARVSISQAAASFIAKRVMRGGPKAVLQAANSVLQQTGEIGARYSAEAHPGDGLRPPRPGSFFAENDQHKLESISLNSGAANAQMDGEIIRGAAIAPSAFGQHMFGATGVDLSDASALELPAMMGIQAWQEVLEQLYRWFTDLAIETSVRAGELGGAYGDPSEREGVYADADISELSLFEADQLAELRDRTGLDLSYSFQMPYPGRRNLPDVTNTFTAALQQLDPQAENEPLVKTMLNFFLTHGVEVEDPAGLTDKVWEEQKKLIEERKRIAEETRKREAEVMKARARQVTRDPQSSAGPGRAGLRGANTRGASADPKRQKKLQADEWDDEWFEQLDLGEQLWLPDDLRDTVGVFAEEQSRVFSLAVTEPAVLAAAALNGGRKNGADPDRDLSSAS